MASDYGLILWFDTLDPKLEMFLHSRVLPIISLTLDIQYWIWVSYFGFTDTACVGLSISRFSVNIYVGLNNYYVLMLQEYRPTRCLFQQCSNTVRLFCFCFLFEKLVLKKIIIIQMFAQSSQMIHANLYLPNCRRPCFKINASVRIGNRQN